MKIYNYDRFGVFLYDSIATEDPLEPGRFLIPARATTLEPPSLGPNQVAVFNETEWAVVPDWRGVYYDENRSRIRITSIGVEPDPAWTAEPRPYSQEELDAQAALKQRIIEIETAQAAEGLRQFTVQQARTWITNKIEGASTVAQVKAEVKDILLKMVPYLLR